MPNIIISVMAQKKRSHNGRTVSHAKIHQRLAELRKERGFSQMAVAEALGLTQALISNYEQGTRRLHADLIARFAEFYDVSADDLLGLKTPNTNKRSAAQADLRLHLIRRMQTIQQLPKTRQKEVLRSIDLLLGGAQAGSSS